MRALTFFAAGLVLSACASDPPPKPRPKPKVEAPKPPPPPADDELPLPKTLADISSTIGHRCPGPMFTLEQTGSMQVRGMRFAVDGSTIRREGPPLKVLKIGVIGAPKDVDYRTIENVQRAQKEFKKAGVQFVLVNGDLGESAELLASAEMIAKQTTQPILIHSGNIEWTTALTEALDTVNKKSPAYINMNLHRHVDLGGVHIVSVPGWSNVKYVKPAACRYDKDNVDEIRGIAERAVSQNQTVILTAHGPPRGRGKLALDFADEAGNVGDESLAEMLTSVPVKFGIFGHILEAGGRATSDVTVQKPIKLPMKTPASSLYVNVGTSSSYGWQMLSGKTSRGMAAIVTYDLLDKGGRAKVTFLTLRK